MLLDQLEIEENRFMFAKPKTTLKDRTDYREAKREVEDATKKLLWIENDFIVNIFNEENKFSYKEIFERFNAIFYNTAKKLRYTCIEIDKFYFFSKYNPQD